MGFEGILGGLIHLGIRDLGIILDLGMGVLVVVMDGDDVVGEWR